MTTTERVAFRRWIEQIATATLWTYAGFIAVLLPAFHYILDAAPGHPPDSLTIRLVAVAISLVVSLAIWLYPGLRRFSSELQILNVLPTMIVVDILVVNSGNHFLYIASAFLMIVAAPQAFYREEYLAACMGVAMIFQVWYSAHAGILFTTTNAITLVVFASGYLMAYVPASLRMRVVRREFVSRLRAQNTAAELAQAEASLKELARSDALTGLPNRNSLAMHLTEILAAEDFTGCAVLFLDLDRFKDVNDTLGHAVGDILLSVVAASLRATIGITGTVARWGGDEFVIIVPGAHDTDRISGIARALSRLFARSFRVDGYELAVTASIGIAIAPNDGVDAAVLIRNADTAMYRAKESFSANFMYFAPEMHAAAANRHRVANGLREALARDAFALHYQPIVDTHGGGLVGAEALIRWPDASGQLRPPAEFIGVAEETGLIVALGAWVLRQVCEDAAYWHLQGHRLHISVNASARQFLHPDFLSTLARTLTASGIDPQLLDIEITESTLLSNVDTVLHTLREVKAMGATVTIDDFGTGYSALAYLKQFPLNALKLDSTFVSDIESHQERAIASSIITIAHTLGMTVTAEGVERPAQLAILRELGCDRAQGYYLGRPVSGTEFGALHLASAS